MTHWLTSTEDNVDFIRCQHLYSFKMFNEVKIEYFDNILMHLYLSLKVGVLLNGAKSGWIPKSETVWRCLVPLLSDALQVSRQGDAVLWLMNSLTDKMKSKNRPHGLLTVIWNQSTIKTVGKFKFSKKLVIKKIIELININWKQKYTKKTQK